MTAVVLYRPSLDVRSGAGRLLLAQLSALRGAGTPAALGCERGALRFFLRTGVRARHLTVSAARSLCGAGTVVVDHGSCVPEASIVFVHNVMTEANRYLGRNTLDSAVAAEREFFGALAGRSSPIVANSHLVETALVERFDLPRARIAVAHPGVRSAVFRADRAPGLRMQARRRLGVADGVPLIGFVTSGDFHKRGLDLFLAAAEVIAREMPRARFLVVGSKRLPEPAREHPLVRAGAALYRPKSSAPEQWIAALDLFLYAARYEEFGLVVAEAMCLGVPVVTSRRVGASECMPTVYDQWLLDEPLPAQLAAKALELLSDAGARRALAEAGIAAGAALDERAYGQRSVALIRGAAGQNL